MVHPKLKQMLSDFIIPYIKEPRMILVPLTYTWNVIPHIIPRDKNDSCPSNLYIECYTIHSSSGRNVWYITFLYNFPLVGKNHDKNYQPYCIKVKH